MSTSTLSPLSSRSAADAERENIRRLNQECGGLSAAVQLLKKGSKEWVMVKSKLDIASEELACVLEDSTMFRSFSDGDAVDLNTKDCLSLIPTPPLRHGREVTKPHSKSDTEFTVPPLVKGKTTGHATKYEEHRYVPHRKGVEISRLPVPDSPNIRGSSWSPDSLHTANSVLEVKPETSRQETTVDTREYTFQRRYKTQQNEFVPKPSLGDLYAQLKAVEKFSMEWFTTKCSIKSEEIRNKELHVMSESAARKESGSTVDDTKYAMDQHLKITTSSGIQIERNNPLSTAEEKSSSAKTKSHVSPQNGDPINSERNKVTQDMDNLTRQLDRMPKYTLEWFETKQKIAALKRKKPLSRQTSKNRDKNRRKKSSY